MIVSKLMILVGCLLKNHVNCVIYATILHHSFIPTIYENLKLVSFFNLSSANTNLKTCIHVWFEQLKELKQFWGIFTG